MKEQPQPEKRVTRNARASRAAVAARLAAVCALAALAARAEQVELARVEQMPSAPSPFEMRDWLQVARDYADYVLVPGAPLPSYVCGKGGPEALNLIAAVLTGAQAGRDMRAFRGRDWVQLCQGFFSEEDGVCGNNLRGSTGGSFWYDLFANVLYCQLAERYQCGQPELRRMAERFMSITNFDHTAVNFHTLQPYDNGRRVEPEGGAGIAWVEYAAWQTFREQRYLEAAERAIQLLEARPSEKSPLYEVLLPYGALVAARLRAEQGREHDVAKWLRWCFEPAPTGARPHWGVIADRFGGYDCHGLVGSVTDTDGYAFAMNGYQWAGALVPLARYDARYARAIGKWMLNLANASRLFYPRALPPEHQDNRTWADAHDPASCVGYEGLRKHPRGKPAPSPFATGDAMQGGAPVNLCLYGSSHVGNLAAIVRRTEDDRILQLDCLATDYYRGRAYPTYLYYNPHGETRAVDAPAGRLYDAAEHRFIERLTIPPDAARLIVVVPAGGQLERHGRHALVGGAVIDYAAE